MKDPYETLGVNRSATDKEMKDAFKKLARSGRQGGAWKIQGDIGGKDVLAQQACPH